jgi:hypothetical protein
MKRAEDERVKGFIVEQFSTSSNVVDLEQQSRITSQKKA